ncbi:MAG: hypothetical protein PQ612_09335 [Rickettsiales bacterium]|nr:hypothetical protein [Pseudomonadota bacterium]MDA0967457.1 hypothetical protein [Pseudomonadota bacterium]MDG4544175.1 hypothetical protein [Rickettsiales bacterium]MDG4546356.1 hypothetical protein [Rickettsiales bacterium]MDG4548499.1 hypothetical protein [Rickettsiales bacterium]
MSDKEDNNKPEEEKVTIIKADHSLKNEIGNLMPLDKILNENIMSEAEIKIKENVDYLKDAYDSLLDHYMFYLRGAYEELKYAESKEEKKQCLKDIQHTALSVKSSAGIFGYDLAEKFATSLYLFIPNIKTFDDRIYLLLESYTKCLEIIAERKITGVENDIAQKLLQEFNSITEQQKKI